MPRFPHAQAAHPQAAVAVRSVVNRLQALLKTPGYADHPSLGLVYVTDAYTPEVPGILQRLRTDFPGVTHWAGAVVPGVLATGVEHLGTPAMAVMLCDLPRQGFAPFSGRAPLGSLGRAHTALVHADAHTPDLAELIPELAARTDSGAVFGGVISHRNGAEHWALGPDDSTDDPTDRSWMLQGGFSGVGFAPEVRLFSRITLGCRPIAQTHRVTQADQNVAYALDDRPALSVLLEDLGVSLDHPRLALDALRNTLAGLGPSGQQAPRGDPIRWGHATPPMPLRHIIGLDTARSGVALASGVCAGMSLTFCRRDPAAAKADLTRICAEIREELHPEAAWPEAAPTPTEPSTPAVMGAVYISCTGRGGPHLGAPNAELQTLRRALGDVPLVGFFSGGEIAHQTLYAYSGVLTVFAAAPK